VEWFEEHGDIAIGFEAGELELHYHFEDGFNGIGPEVEFEPDEAYIRASDATRVENITSALPFLGAAAGSDIWVLPQSNSGPQGADALGVPFVGIAAELDGPPFVSAELLLTDVTGPGEFALWQSPPTLFDPPSVFMQSQDGFDNTDLLPLTVGAHDHYNFGFSAPGVYQVTFAATAVAIPEPGSLGVMASIAAMGTAMLRRRRK
ncbi:MAG: choice-of-anchor M domain-containing protein, partial [Planctomycetota bacterium]